MIAILVQFPTTTFVTLIMIWASAGLVDLPLALKRHWWWLSIIWILHLGRVSWIRIILIGTRFIDNTLRKILCVIFITILTLEVTSTLLTEIPFSNKLQRRCCWFWLSSLLLQWCYMSVMTSQIIDNSTTGSMKIPKLPLLVLISTLLVKREWPDSPQQMPVIWKRFHVITVKSLI